MKYKTNIWPKLFYFNLIIIFILTILLTINMLDGIIFGTMIYDHINDINELKSKLEFYAMGKVFSYISNISLVIGYLIYLVIIRHKVKVGYLFILSWIIIFIALSSSPFYIQDFDENLFKMFINSLITVLNLFIVFGLIYLGWFIKTKRKIQRYEYYKIHSSRKDSK